MSLLVSEHLQHACIDHIADSLGIDYAPADMGFEMRNGRTIPKMASIIVVQQNKIILLEAHS